MPRQRESRPRPYRRLTLYFLAGAVSPRSRRPDGVARLARRDDHDARNGLRPSSADDAGWLARLILVGPDQVCEDLAEFADVVLGKGLGEVAPDSCHVLGPYLLEPAPSFRRERDIESPPIVPADCPKDERVTFHAV